MPFLPPWKVPPLDKWFISKIKHRYESGVLYLCVHMFREGQTISAEGPDDENVWKDIQDQAYRLGTE